MKASNIQPINSSLPNMFLYYTHIYSHMPKPGAEITKITAWLKCARQREAFYIHSHNFSS